MTQIEDGKGRGFKAEVNDEQELVTRAIGESELEHSSVLGNAFCWFSGAQDIDATDTMMFVKNTGDIPLILDRLNLIGSNVVCTWSIHIGADTTTPAGGSVITGTNINESFSSKLADAVARTDETAVADGTLVEQVVTPIATMHHHDLEGIILGKNHYIQINQETESTAGSVAIYGHFETPS